VRNVRLATSGVMNQAAALSFTSREPITSEGKTKKEGQRS
jgi:hypothetical protein